MSRRWIAPLLAGAVLALIGTLAGVPMGGMAGSGFGPAPAAAAAGQTNAQGDNQFVTIDLAPTGNVPWDFGWSVPAQVTLEASRAVTGVLQVVDSPQGGSSTTWEFDIDLAAGSTATVPVVLTSGWDGIQVTAVFSSGGETLASEAIRRHGDGAGTRKYLAVLGVDDPPRRVPELATGEQLPTIELTTGMRGLDDAATLVVTPVALRELGPESVDRQTIDAWIRGGGQLVVDGPAESLEAGYHQFPTANSDRFLFGSGSVLYDRSWRDGVPLGGYVGSAGLSRLVENQGLGWGSGGELAQLAGLALPGAGLVAIILFGYAVVAGPGLFLALGVTRRERLLWTVLPVLSLVVASAILVVGFFDRRGRSDAHITIVEVGAEGSRATTNLLLGSGFGGNRELVTPEGWQYLGQGRTAGQRPVHLRVGRTTTAVGVEMPSGSSAVIRLAGVAPSFDDLLTIEAIEAGSDGTITARVTNHADVTLREAVVMLGNVRSEFGELPPGEPVEVSIEPDTGETRPMRELLLWPRVEQAWHEGGRGGPVAVPTDDDAVTAAGAWTEWRVERGTSLSPENVLGVVAWSDQLSSPVTGGSNGLTAVLARANVPAGLSSSTGFASVARLPTFNEEPVFDGNFIGYAEDIRVTVDSQTEVSDLAIEVDDQSSAVALWVDGAWRYLELPDRGDAVIAFPPEAIDGGEILVRSFQPEWAWGTGATVRVVPAAGLDPDAAVLSDTVDHRAAGGGRMFEEEFGPGGPGMDDLEPMETVEVGPLAEGDEFVHQGFLEPFTRASFLIDLEEGQRLTATMRSPRRDSYLELRDLDGRVLAENDDFGEGVDSRIVYDIAESGTYDLWARELGAQEVNYEITLEVEG